MYRLMFISLLIELLVSDTRALIISLHVLISIYVILALTPSTNVFLTHNLVVPSMKNAPSPSQDTCVAFVKHLHRARTHKVYLGHSLGSYLPPALTAASPHDISVYCLYIRVYARPHSLVPPSINDSIDLAFSRHLSHT